MIVTSEEGEHWIQRVSGTTRRFNGVSFGNGLFVAVCSAGTGPALVISQDGRDWEPVDYVPSGIGDIAFGNGVFVCMIPTNGAIHFSVSTDGRTWERRIVTSNYPTIYDFAYFNGAFVSVGPSGQVFQSDPVFRVTFDHLTGIGVIDGPSSGLFRVEAANALGSSDAWMDLTNLTSFPYIFSDTEANSRPFRFYRARFVE
jgi:hypothetical protein